MVSTKTAMVSRVFMFLSLLLIQLSSFESRVHPLHPKTSGKIGSDRRTFGRTLGGIDQRTIGRTLGGIDFGRSNEGNDQRTFGRTLGGINQRTFGRTLGGIDIITNTRNAEIADPVLDNTDPENTGSAMDLENPASTCSCNGAIDENYHGECSKETVWCYVDPDAPCEDSEVWYGGFGHGWSYSHEACEAHLAEVHKDECQVLSENQEALNTTETEDKECSCNGELDSINMGECRTPWIGRFWCYVDSVGSGCEDAKVWYGQFGFCQTFSFMACEGYDHGYEYNYDEDNADSF